MNQRREKNDIIWWIVNGIIAASVHVGRATNYEPVQIVTNVVIQTLIHRPLFVRKTNLL